MRILLLTLLCFSTTALAGPGPRPSDAEIERALATLVKLSASYDDAAKQQRSLLGMATLALLSELAGVEAMDPRSPPSPAVKKKARELEKKGIRVGDAMEPVIAEFRAYACRSMQSEAKTQLKSLYVALESYRAEYDVYIKDFKKLGWQPRGATVRYRYEIVSAARSKFLARATGVADEVKGDVWELDQDLNLVNVKKSCG
jgi:hypothetical protein